MVVAGDPAFVDEGDAVREAGLLAPVCSAGVAVRLRDSNSEAGKISSVDMGEGCSGGNALERVVDLAVFVRGIKVGRDGAARSSTLLLLSALALMLFMALSFDKVIERGCEKDALGLRLSGSGKLAFCFGFGGRPEDWALSIFGLDLRCSLLLFCEKPPAVVLKRLLPMLPFADCGPRSFVPGLPGRTSAWPRPIDLLGSGSGVENVIGMGCGSCAGSCSESSFEPSSESGVGAGGEDGVDSGV